MPTDQMTENDGLKGCMDKLDSLIKAGGASADDLEELKMDLEDASGMNMEEESMEGDSEDSSDSSKPALSIMIGHMQDKKMKPGEYK